MRNMWVIIQVNPNFKTHIFLPRSTGFKRNCKLNKHVCTHLAWALEFDLRSSLKQTPYAKGPMSIGQKLLAKLKLLSFLLSIFSIYFLNILSNLAKKTSKVPHSFFNLNFFRLSSYIKAFN